MVGRPSIHKHSFEFIVISLNSFDSSLMIMTISPEYISMICSMKITIRFETKNSVRVKY